jgi:hypothetical protein
LCFGCVCCCFYGVLIWLMCFFGFEALQHESLKNNKVKGLIKVV